MTPLNETIASYFRDYFALLARISTGPYMPKTRMAQNVLDTLLYGVNELYSSRPDSQNRIKSRKEEICREFIQLVIENYTTERRAQFYAAKLGISLQHLSTTIKQVTGKNVLDLIAHVVIIDIKAEIHGHDHPGDSLFAELPQRLVLRQVFQAALGNESAGIQKQLAPYPFTGMMQESAMTVTASMGVNSIPYTG